MSDERYDVTILGSGIAGAALAAVLARNGVKTLLLEQGVHPRFAIGESTVPETTFLFRVLAARYRVPELGNLSTYTKLRRAVGSTSGVKRNFTFAFHRAGELHRPEECSQLSTLSPPLGPDVHLFRQDVDAYLMATAVHYGAEIRQQTDVAEVDIQDCVRLKTRRGEMFESDYVVDAGGIKSLLADQLGLREAPIPLKTHSRTLFTHMLGVKAFDLCTGPRQQHGLPSPLSQGTLHHLFEGGWIWVIPFGNHPASTNRLCSVGLTLDPRQHPLDGLGPEQEFRRLVAKFPSVARQFEHARAIRAWTRSDRLQFSSKALIGERYCLMPHAFAFVDPLFSSGLTISMNAVNMLAWRLIRAKADGDYSTARFQLIEDRVKRDFGHFDRLVSRSYVAFSNFKLWNAWYRVWAIGGLYGSLGVLEPLGRFWRTGDPSVFEDSEKLPYAGAQASQLPEYRALLDAAGLEVDRVQLGQQSAVDGARNIFGAIAQSCLWPPPWGPLDDETRHAGIFTLPRLSRFARWMLTEAPECLRKSYFIHFGVRELLSLTKRDLVDEVVYDGRVLAVFMRDFLVGYNRDWSKVSD